MGLVEGDFVVGLIEGGSVGAFVGPLVGRAESGDVSIELTPFRGASGAFDGGNVKGVNGCGVGLDVTGCIVGESVGALVGRQSESTSSTCISESAQTRSAIQR